MYADFASIKIVMYSNENKERLILIIVGKAFRSSQRLLKKMRRKFLAFDFIKLGAV